MASLPVRSYMHFYSHESEIVTIIEEARLDRGISIAELARRVSIDKKRLWYVLKGTRAMRIDEFVRVCAFFDLGMGRFINHKLPHR